MAVIPKGSKMKMIEVFGHGDDINIDYGKTRWLAQTFTLHYLTVVWRFRVKSWTIIGGKAYHYDLHNTDATGQPIGPPIAETSIVHRGEYKYSPGKWRRLDFNSFPKLLPGTYALVCSIPHSPNTFGHKWRADSTNPPYKGGQAWESNDSGNTWTEIAGTDFLFEVWGYHPPPEPPPPDVLKNWAMLDISYIVMPPFVKIIVTTDIEIHLFMRWTLNKPLKHPVSELRRGILVMTGTRYCFTTWEENEQIEPGDTFIHTFIKPNWPTCQTRYFYFIGTKVAEESPSSSPIFYYHNAEVTVTYPYYEQIDDSQWTKWLRRHSPGESYAACHDNPDASDVLTSGVRFVAQHKFAALNFSIDRKPLYFLTSPIPNDATILSAILYSYMTFVPTRNKDLTLLNVPELTYPPEKEDYGRILARKNSPIGDLLTTDQTTSRRCIWKITQAGLSSINLTGITKWAIMTIPDRDKQPPVTTVEGVYLDAEPSHLIVSYARPIEE